MTASNPTPIRSTVIPLQAGDGARAELLMDVPDQPRYGLLWIPALGMPARHYQALAQALAAHGIAVARHEWRGIGSSSLRAGRHNDWGYRELFADLDDSVAAARVAAPGLQWIVAGHSLGSQFASMVFALRPDLYAGLVVVAGGTPYWRNFAGRTKLAIRLLFSLGPGLAALRGYFPGRRFGFAGNEARGVIGDWARSGIDGRYAPRHVDADIETAFTLRRGPLLGLWPDDDWLTPRASFEHLLSKLARADISRVTVTAADFDGLRADHFGWLRQPLVIAAAIDQWSRQSLPRSSTESQ